MDTLPLGQVSAADRATLEVMGQYDAPAYIRRALRMEAAVDQLQEKLRQQREELLEMVRLRLGVLNALAGGWQRLEPWLEHADQVEVLERLHAELSPRLRVPVDQTASPRRLRSALRELCQAIARFNQRWLHHLNTVDCQEVNALIDGYNRYYVFEKECVVRSPIIARTGFQRLEPLSPERLLATWPLLPCPPLRP